MRIGAFPWSPERALFDRIVDAASHPGFEELINAIDGLDEFCDPQHIANRRTICTALRLIGVKAHWRNVFHLDDKGAYVIIATDGYIYSFPQDLCIADASFPIFRRRVQPEDIAQYQRWIHLPNAVLNWVNDNVKFLEAEWMWDVGRLNPVVSEFLSLEWMKNDPNQEHAIYPSDLLQYARQRERYRYYQQHRQALEP